MNRLKMEATDGMILTNGETYGTEVYLTTGMRSPWQNMKRG